MAQIFFLLFVLCFFLPRNKTKHQTTKMNLIFLHLTINVKIFDIHSPYTNHKERHAERNVTFQNMDTGHKLPSYVKQNYLFK